MIIAGWWAGCQPSVGWKESVGLLGSPVALPVQPVVGWQRGLLVIAVAKTPNEWPDVSDIKALNYFGGMSGEMETPGDR